MINRVRHIGPALDVQGGISSVLVSYKNLFNLPREYFIASYNGSFVRSLPLIFLVCLKLLLMPEKGIELYQVHTSADGSFFRKFLISLCLRLRGKNYMAHIHGSRFQEFCRTSPGFVQKCVRSYLRHAEIVICITPDMQEFLDAYVGKGICKFSVIPNPCQTIAAKSVELESHGLPVKIVFSGRYGHRKGVYDLIRAFEQAKFEVPVELHLFGDGEVEKVHAIADASPVHAAIHVSGWLRHSEYLELLKNFDLLALPSYAETFGMSLVEAMGFGLPVISTFSGGVPYVVENGEDGFLVNAGDVAALTEKLEKLVNNRELRISMGLHAWKSCVQKFAGQVVLKQLENCYSQVREK